MKDRSTAIISILVALVLHAAIILVAIRQYSSSTLHQARANQAAGRLKTIKGQPVRFIYVKDMVPGKLPPMDRSRLSDMNRHGASPNKVKGLSPDPTSFGGSSIRQSGGPGNAPFSRPSMRMASRRAVPPLPGIKGAYRKNARDEKPSRNTDSRKETTKGLFKEQRVIPTRNNVGLPAGGKPGPGFKPPKQGSGAIPARPPRSAISGQIQRMMVGSLQGGYNNPIASRLNTGQLSFDTAAWDLGPYARKVQERVQSNWHMPEVERTLRQQGWVAIHFVIHKDGSVTDIQVVRPSGIPSYNQSAMDALISSNPLPPLPSEVTVPQLSGIFRFFYNMPDGN